MVDFCMPVASVINTLIGSFSTFKKLHIYLISFQKKKIVKETAKTCWSSRKQSIFFLLFPQTRQRDNTISVEI